MDEFQLYLDGLTDAEYRREFGGPAGEEFYLAMPEAAVPPPPDQDLREPAAGPGFPELPF